MTTYRALSAALALLAVGCGDMDREAPTPATLSEGSELIYGADDRREVYQLVDPAEIALARSTVALVGPNDLSPINGGYLLDTSVTLAQSKGVCADEPYANQPTPAYCSGFLVGPDLIATAGHCIDASSCGSTAFVFGFEMIDAQTVRAGVPTDNVYFCSQIVARAETATDDWAVVRVDRGVAGRQPLPIRRAGTVPGGTDLVLSGHPVGLPLKIAGGAQVRENSHPNFFQSNVDSYGGNSGSPVMGRDGVVEGVLVRGNTDFVLSGKGRNRCYRSNVCPDSGCPTWEEVSRTTRFAQFVDAAPQCAADADCDDGDPCNGAETCNGGACNPGNAPDCDDGDACTNDSCVAEGAGFACASTTVTCDDGDPCTVDLCDAQSGCSSTPLACGAGETCEAGVCVAAPQCLPRGAACGRNSDCCSNSCHRRRGCR